MGLIGRRMGGREGVGERRERREGKDTHSIMVEFKTQYTGLYTHIHPVNYRHTSSNSLIDSSGMWRRHLAKANKNKCSK